MLGFVNSGFLAAPRAAQWNTCRVRVQVTKADGQRKALIFDCDGVILESESLHRDAYNQVFREFDVKYEWTPEYYDELQNTIGGGKPKMRYYFGLYGWPESKLGPSPTMDTDRIALVDALQERKTSIYQEYIANGVAKLRPGVARLMDEAIQARSRGELLLAICSASTKSSVWFVLRNLLGEERISNFDVILAGDDVEKKKPNPEIYNVARERLGVRAEDCMVIEDSLIGLQAALAAGMSCCITYTSSTENQNFVGAKGVYAELGDDLATGVTLKKLFSDIAQVKL
eukprot:Plantae.Rhodophyta-Purpureofilum_apyrenoidigerum.ctg13724.p1 GENE.Plantae.Rhodophyta-Purpureofilum_apyrenoidigerum.ctg13724~~Plantae.Rhodophyta-Purpureofilum_apyrenoidigerum.ctg13724.p1  ORF type:complete len:286 (+),score=39.28 Plantae.Rhodophyta-Purpureofilum_apyrenoidigerum.ctg13724:164-1021(+)